jgi:hypothetical protein
MAGFLTTFGANSFLDGDPLPTTLWIKGHTGSPDGDAAGHEAVETRRISFTRTAAVNGSCSNPTARTLFAASTTEDWTHLSLWDDEFAGNPWWVTSLASALAVVVNSIITLPSGLLVISFERWS